MSRSRRDFLRSLGIGAAAGAAIQWPLQGGSTAWAFQSARNPLSDGFIHLDSNENAYGPSPKVADAIRSATGLVNRYTFRKYNEVTERIANFHKVKPEQVLFGCGSTELLRVAACAFLGQGRQLVEAWPTFEAIDDYARSLGAEAVRVPLNRGFVHDLEGMLTRAKSSTGLVYICNPNNPTATIAPRQDIESFIAKLPGATHVVIDEAYHHYAKVSGMYASFIERPLEDERVIVTRTFSKAYGLAGLRLGYAIAAPQAINQMRNFLTKSTLNAIMAEVVGVALDDADGVELAIKRNRDDRQEFFNQAMERMLMPIDSHTNFVMTNTQHPVEEVIAHFHHHKILIGRHFPPLDTYIRVSLGTPDEMTAFWQTWDMIPWSKKFIHH
ncbi:MAG: pyridoxal phosphate-dependent aminotransferase [Terriglobales bacterium]